MAPGVPALAIADVNGDGFMDIYVCHSGKYDDPQN